MTKVTPKGKQLSVIGWREMLILPELKVEGIKAKIDTGARTSALHAFNCQEFLRNGQKMIRFIINPHQRDRHYRILAEAELLEYRKVKNSGGQVQLRPVIMTPVQLGEHQWQVELTLTNRDVMGFRMLLGRQAIRARFAIDPGRSFLQSKQF